MVVYECVILFPLHILVFFNQSSLPDYVSFDLGLLLTRRHLTSNY